MVQYMGVVDDLDDLVFSGDQVVFLFVIGDVGCGMVGYFVGDVCQVVWMYQFGEWWLVGFEVFGCIVLLLYVVGNEDDWLVIGGCLVEVDYWVCIDDLCCLQ